MYNEAIQLQSASWTTQVVTPVGHRRKRGAAPGKMVLLHRLFFFVGCSHNSCTQLFMVVSVLFVRLTPKGYTRFAQAAVCLPLLSSGLSDLSCGHCISPSTCKRATAMQEHARTCSGCPITNCRLCFTACLQLLLVLAYTYISHKQP